LLCKRAGHSPGACFVQGLVQARLMGPIDLGVGTGRHLHWLCGLAAALLSYWFSCDSGVPHPCRSVVQLMVPFPVRLRFDLSLLVASSPKTSRRYTMLSAVSSATSRMWEYTGHFSHPHQASACIPQVTL